MYHGLGTTDLSVTGSGDGVILAKAAADQAERNRAALAYQAMVDQRNMTYGIAALVAVVAVGWWASKRYTPNKRHRVRRRRGARMIPAVITTSRDSGGDLASDISSVMEEMGCKMVGKGRYVRKTKGCTGKMSCPAHKVDAIRDAIREVAGNTTRGFDVRFKVGR